MECSMKEIMSIKYIFIFLKIGSKIYLNLLFSEDHQSS